MKDELPLYAEGPVEEYKETKSIQSVPARRVLIAGSGGHTRLASMGLVAALAGVAAEVCNARRPMKGGYDGFDIQPAPDYQSMMTPRNQRRMQKKALKKPRR